MRYIQVLLLLAFSLGLFAQDRMKRPDVPGEVMVDLGLNFWDASSDSIDQKGWTSKSVALYYLKRKPLSDKLSLMYGGGLGLEKFSLGNTYTLYSTADSAYFDLFADSLNIMAVDKNRLATTYLDITAEIRFHPKGTEEGEGFFVGLGGIAGVRLDTHTKWKYDANGESVIHKISGEFDMNSIRYGAQIRLGFRGIHLFYKQYFSNVFNSRVGVVGSTEPGVNPTFSTVGINITGF